MDTFFAGLGFPLLDRTIHPHTHFQRLIQQRGWAVGSRNHRRATAAFNEALLATFAERFGNDASPPVEVWQRLCAALGARTLPETVTQCKKFIKRTHVNLVDLMAGADIHVFRSKEELIEYTRATERYFPRKMAKERGGGLLRCLLREMPAAVLEQTAAEEEVEEVGEVKEMMMLVVGEALEGLKM